MRFSSSDPVDPPPGLRRDLQRAREGAFASAAELREFVQNLRGKSPQEVLGEVANSGLAQGVGIATVGTIILMAVFTIGPYYLYPKQSPKPKAEAASTAASEAKPADAAAKPAEAAEKPSKNAEANARQSLEKMGEAETKTADPKVNPLDNLDDLLDSKK